MPVTSRETPAACCNSPDAARVAGAATSAKGFFQTPVVSGRCAPSSTSRARFGFVVFGDAPEDVLDEVLDDVPEEFGGTGDDTPMIARQRVQRTRRPDAPARETRSSGMAYFAPQLMHV
jgi:hypothetical protein